MFSYLLYLCIGIIVIIHIYIKIRFRFWSSQPIFHTYNLIYWLFPPGIIQYKIPESNKFYNHSLSHHRWRDLDNKTKSMIYSFIKMNYIKFETKYNTKKSDFINTISDSAFITLQKQRNPKKILSCLTTRPLECFNKNKKFNLWFFDFLCVHRKERKKSLGYKQIYTHYCMSRKNTKDFIFLYKDTGHCDIRVPLTIFKTYSINSSKWERINYEIPRNIITYLINSSNSELLFHFLSEVRINFDCIIMPKTFDLGRLIDCDIILPTVILDHQDVVATIFFRRSLASKNNEQIIECIGSYCRKGYEETFKDSFQNSIALLKKHYKFSIIRIENISHNYILLQKILKKSIPKRVDNTGYYFYNCASTPLFSPNVFAIY